MKIRRKINYKSRLGFFTADTFSAHAIKTAFRKIGFICWSTFFIIHSSLLWFFHDLLDANFFWWLYIVFEVCKTRRENIKFKITQYCVQHLLKCLPNNLHHDHKKFIKFRNILPHFSVFMRLFNSSLHIELIFHY